MKLLPTYHKPTQFTRVGRLCVLLLGSGPGLLCHLRVAMRVATTVATCGIAAQFGLARGPPKIPSCRRPSSSWELTGDTPKRKFEAEVTAKLIAQQSSKTQNSRGPGPKSQIRTRPQSPYVHMGSLNFATAGSSQSRGTPRLVPTSVAQSKEVTTEISFSFRSPVFACRTTGSAACLQMAAPAPPNSWPLRLFRVSSST